MGNDIQRGDRVIIKYMGQEGVVVEVNGNTCIVSYMNERDQEIVETFNIEDVKKC